MKQITKKQGGFTLIEVVLVLAIGALIILMALLAFNGAQRARRDTARTNAAGQMISALEQYAANNNSSYPASVSAANFASNIKDPKTNTGPVGAADATRTTLLVYLPDKSCVGTAPTGTNPGGYAISYTQESGTVVCKDNL